MSETKPQPQHTKPKPTKQERQRKAHDEGQKKRAKSEQADAKVLAAERAKPNTVGKLGALAAPAKPQSKPAEKKQEIKPKPVCVTQSIASWKDILPNVEKWDKAKAAGHLTEAQWPGTHALKAACTTKPKTSRAEWCRPCYKIVRRAQLAYNNITWKKHKAAGKAGHHAEYMGKPTKVVVALKKLGKDPEKYVVQGEPLPKTVAEAVAKVEVPKMRKRPEPVKKEAPPTKHQAEIAKRARESAKKDLEKGKGVAAAARAESKKKLAEEAKPQRPAPPAPPKVEEHPLDKRAKKKLVNDVAVSQIERTLRTKRTKKTKESPQATLPLVEGPSKLGKSAGGTTFPDAAKVQAGVMEIVKDVEKPAEAAAKLAKDATPRAVAPTGHVYADQAVMGKTYLIAGKQASLFSKLPSGDMMFELVDGSGKPFKMTANALIKLG